MSELFLLSSLLLSPATTMPSVQDYRTLMLGLRQKANFTFHWPGQKPAAISYELNWNGDRTKASSPELQSELGATMGLWVDRLWTAEGSFLKVEKEDQPLPIDCVYVRGQDNGSDARSPLQPRHIIRVYIVTNDRECRGPLNTNPKIYTSSPELWDTYLYYEIRDTTVMLPVEPKLRLYRNKVNIMLED